MWCSVDLWADGLIRTDNTMVKRKKDKQRFTKNAYKTKKAMIRFGIQMYMPCNGPPTATTNKLLIIWNGFLSACNVQYFRIFFKNGMDQ
jgi:hypothetical protein